MVCEWDRDLDEFDHAANRFPSEFHWNSIGGMVLEGLIYSSYFEVNVNIPFNSLGQS